MRVLLGLRESELCLTLFGHPLAQRVLDFLLGISRGHVAVVLIRVIDHAQDRSPIGTHRYIKRIKIRLRERRQNLPRPIGSEVQAKEPVAIFGSGIVSNRRCHDELVALIARISRFHRRNTICRGMFCFACHPSAIGLRHPLPAVVPIHRIIASSHRANLGAIWHLRLQGLEILQRRFRRHITAVRHRMQHHRHTGIRDRLHCGHHMGDMSMHPAVRHHAHQMRRATCIFEFGDKRLQRGIVKKRAVLDGQINLPQIHRHHTARANIGVSHLGVAHLPAWQANVWPMGDQSRRRTIRHHRIKVGRFGKIGRIGLGLIRQPPAIQNAQYNGLWRHGHLLQ
mmetsp:Transcript_32480/g.62560  ORF Transcript_32480/g.62560 Transcript_32480/m.62560 type:complete len:339 (+) Transcript_32480:2061-3077(+)